MSDKVKQVLVLRTDLNMRKGKLAAQAAHASMKVLLDYSQAAQELEKPSFTYSPLTGLTYTVSHHRTLGLWPEAAEWLAGSFTKIVVGIESEEKLISLYERVGASGLHVALVIDNGLTEFHGVKTLTCLAIGPEKAEEIDKFTKELKLL